MTERPPSAEAARIADALHLLSGNREDGARMIDALCEHRVKAETERCAQVAQQAADYARVGPDLVVIPARTFASDLALDIRDAIRAEHPMSKA